MNLEPIYERSSADPSVVHDLVTAIGLALDQAYIPEVTTTADVLSALFTSLDYALRTAREDGTPEDHQHNSSEINRVLMELLVGFGDIKAN